ncbi:hypothetical protein KR093_002173 [Drosophila rubida]|uniref:Bromo domain-containing protein n=1 Tax=Drosophila rubida TaxID=30044 RepID=A0AAD4KAM2_9MUSC|nr:hypothetical protein KR093_002173 [Drosophila rubida]
MAMPKNTVIHNDDQITLSFLLDKVHDDVLLLTDSTPFRKPAKKKVNNTVVKNPMDLETMGMNIVNQVYQSRADYLQDIQLIADNTAKCKGANAKHTICARNMLEHARGKMKEYDHFFCQLEVNIIKHLKQAKAKLSACGDVTDSSDGSDVSDSDESDDSRM